MNSTFSRAAKPSIDDQLAVKLELFEPMRVLKETLDRRAILFKQGPRFEIAQDNIRKYCQVNFQQEREEATELAHALGDFAASLSVAVMMLAKSDNPLEMHHLYLGFIIEKIGHLMKLPVMEKIGMAVKLDDALNHTLAVAGLVENDDDSPLHYLNDCIWKELAKYGIHYPSGI